ncbi:MAG: FtsX-like permease family protein [Candidatus Saccharimonadales bacterium]
MIRPKDATTLALAKLHSRRILLALTVLTSGLLFGSLYAGTFIFSGVENSMTSFNKEAHNGQYLVKASPVIPQDIYPNNSNLNSETIKELNSMYADYIVKAKQSAKEQNIPFDASVIKSPLKPSPFTNPALPSDEQLMVNFYSPVYTEYSEKLLKQYAENAPNTQAQLKKTASKYDYKDIFPTITAQTSYTDTVYLKDGKEDLDYLLKNAEPYTTGLTMYGYAVNSVRNASYEILDNALLQNWILPVNEKRKDNADSIPVIITTKEAVGIFGKDLNIGSEPSLAADKIEWIKNLQNKINGQNYTSCFRNNAERLQIAQAIKDLSEIKENEKNKDYIPPKIIYNLPSEACGAMTVKKDDRSSAEKKENQSRIETEKRLGTYSEPQRKLLKFQIVGIVDISERSFDTPRNIDDLANNLFANNLSAGALIPKDLYENSSAKMQYDSILFGERSKGVESKDVYTKYGLLENILVFNDLTSARQFIKNEGCSETSPDCKKLFRLDPFGSNYLLLDDIQRTTRNILNIMLPIAIGVAGIIMLFTISRIIIDSRRETAVFRALGAKRADIVAVYITYSLLVSLLTLVTSITIGIITAIVVQAINGVSFTAQAHVAYGLFDSLSIFSFFGVNYGLLVSYGVGIILIGIIATILPLLRNVRRNPITDMREE